MTLSDCRYIKSLIKLDELNLNERLKAENILEEYEKSLEGENTMKIEVKVRKIIKEGVIKGIVSVTLDDSIAIHDIKIIQLGDKKKFLAMPSRKDENGIHRDICHPINEDFRIEITQAVLEAYQTALEESNNE